MARSVLKQVRAIPNDELPEVEGEDADDQTLADMGVHVQFRGNEKTIVLCVGYEGDEWPGELISGQVGMYGKARRNQTFQQIRGKPPSNPDIVKINRGFDRLAVDKLPEEFERIDEEGNVISAQPRTERERFERRFTKIFGDD